MVDYEKNKENVRSKTHYAEKPLNSRLKAIVDTIPENASVLDVACGTGRVLHAATKRGCTGRGIELSPGGATAAQQKDLDVIQGDADSWNENPEVHELMFAPYDVAIFSKCLMYLKTKNQIIDQLNADVIIIFQKNPSYWKFRIWGDAQQKLGSNDELAYRLKGGDAIEIDSPKAFVRWAESYGYQYSERLRGGLFHRSMIVKLSRKPL